MFSGRVIALTALAIYLLPTDPARQESFARTTEGLFVRVATFCDRNGETCATAGHGWAIVKEKASFGFAVLYGLAMRKISSVSGNDNGAVPPPFENGRVWLDHRPGEAKGGTLTRDDLAPAWRGSGQSRKISFHQ